MSAADAVPRLLKELVAIDSTSARSNRPIVEVLEARLNQIGARTQRQTYVDAAGVEKINLIAQLGSGTAELALVGHTDCVPFDSAWTEALTLTERAGNLYGRGACDTKGFIAAAVVALDNVKHLLRKPAVLVFTADEEVGCLGAKKLMESKLLNAKRAIVGEPTSLQPVRANKGYCLTEIEIAGKEGHSAYPDSGASANFRAGRFLVELERYSLGRLRAHTRPDFEPPFTTLNVGMMSGGKAKNVIAGVCRLTLEWRPIPGQKPEQVLDDVKLLLEAQREADKGFAYRLAVARMDGGFDTAEEDPLVQRLATLCGHRPITVAFGTEGPQMAALGATPVVFGPGNIQVAHQNGEFVPVQQLLQSSLILEGMLRSFCGNED
jgi:acetylornithine deacetylase